MKKLWNFFSIFSKIIFFIFILIFGWVFIQVSSLTKGKKSAEKRSPNIFGPNEANADVPACGGCTGTTPFLAVHDGKEYRLENDFMFGRPKSYWYDYNTARTLYEDGRISPDLYKISQPIMPVDGKIKLQIQEIEPEESHFNWIQLKRVLHPVNTELIVDSEYRKFFIVNKKLFENAIVLPETENSDASRIVHKKYLWERSPELGSSLQFDRENKLELKFKNLDLQKIPHLVIKSWYRDWVLGIEEDWESRTSLASWISKNRFEFTRAFLFLVLAFLGTWLSKGKGGQGLAILPYFIGSGGCDGGACGDGPGSVGCSFIYEYKDWKGDYARCTVSEPRVWAYNTEVIELPREAVQPDGTLELRIHSSKRHTLGFAGLVQGIERMAQSPMSEEYLDLTKAFHNRLNKDVASSLNSYHGEYVETIPGDIIDIEFERPKTNLKLGEKETYVIRASGFYTPLRKENRAKAGDWQSKISLEAKERLRSVKKLSAYR